MSGVDQREQAAGFLRAGRVIAHRTDTVMGLAAAARMPEALALMAALKGRPQEQPFLCLIDEPARLDSLTHSVPRYVVDLIGRHWPGPLTLILRARPEAPCRAADGSIALRCPDHELTRFLCREVAGTLASSSANRTGGPVAKDAADAVAIFGVGEAGLAMALEDAVEAERPRPAHGANSAVEEPLPSTILDCREAAPRLVRAGVLTPRELGLA